MANVSFGKGSLTLTGTTSSFPDGMIYFNTSSKKIYLNNGGTVVTFDGNNTNTDTKNTAGSSNTSSKIYLVGATSQGANPQTYSHDTAYVGTDGYVYSGSSPVYSGWITVASSPVKYSTFISSSSYSSIRALKPTRVWCKLVDVPRNVFYQNSTSSSVFVSDLIYERTVGAQASSTVTGTEYRLVSPLGAGEAGITYQSWLGWTTSYLTNYYLYVSNGTLVSRTMSNNDQDITAVKNTYLYVCGYQF